jgi:hypothetical protein
MDCRKNATVYSKQAKAGLSTLADRDHVQLGNMIVIIDLDCDFPGAYVPLRFWKSCCCIVIVPCTSHRVAGRGSHGCSRCSINWSSIE